mmetsp:Transcript_20596/g.45082  ORF Transcript_20596/g.45082 Transcript_20596/m.45082 type:complete len:386 (+) Transcript_20596:3-1160(+)
MSNSTPKSVLREARIPTHGLPSRCIASEHRSLCDDLRRPLASLPNPLIDVSAHWLLAPFWLQHLVNGLGGLFLHVDAQVTHRFLRCNCDQVIKLVVYLHAQRPKLLEEARYVLRRIRIVLSEPRGNFGAARRLQMALASFVPRRLWQTRLRQQVAHQHVSRIRVEVAVANSGNSRLIRFSGLRVEQRHAGLMLEGIRDSEPVDDNAGRECCQTRKDLPDNARPARSPRCPGRRSNGQLCQWQAPSVEHCNVQPRRGEESLLRGPEVNDALCHVHHAAPQEEHQTERPSSALPRRLCEEQREERTARELEKSCIVPGKPDFLRLKQLLAPTWCEIRAQQPATDAEHCLQIGERIAEEEAHIRSYEDTREEQLEHGACQCRLHPEFL